MRAVAQALLAAMLGTGALVAAEPPATPTPAPAVTEDAAAEDTSSSEPVDSRFQHFASKLSPSEPLYFSLGWRDSTNARFQISFKYRFLDPEGGAARRVPLLRSVYFGYTQTTLWDIGAASAPFFDTSYRPSLFVLRDRVHALGKTTRLGLRYGLEHESNGQGGSQSRSLNIAYLTPVLIAEQVLGGQLRIAPKVYAYIGDLSDNPDIAEYRGYADLQAEWLDADGFGVALTLRKGTKAGRGSLQVDLSYPLDRLLGGNLEAYLHVQYFDGWGETLRTYDQRLPSQLRIGLMVVR
jgi:outer membrane phospholipase A